MQTLVNLSKITTMNEFNIPIIGMTCASCVNRIEKSLSKLSGVEKVQVNLATEMAQVRMSKDVPLLNVINSIENSGYSVATEEIKFRVKGMTCASCVNTIDKFLIQVSGVIQVNINLASEEGRVTVVKGLVNNALIKKAILDAGYDVEFYKDGKTKNLIETKENELKKDKIRLIISALLTMPLVVPMIFEMFGFHLMPPAGLQILLATPVQFYFGARFYKAAYRALKAKTGNMDLLVALGTSAAYGLSLYQVFQNWGALDHLAHRGVNLYFESSAVIITLILLGKYLEAKSKQQTSEAIKALQMLKPEFAVVIRNGVQIQIALDEVQIGDQVLVKAGERIPVDGQIINGSTQVDESMMTGESLPVFKTRGDLVTGGSVNLDGTVQIETKAVGAESTLAKIIRLVETAQTVKAPIQRLVDKVSAVFVPIVIVISLVTILGWGFWDGNWEKAILYGVAVMVIACPCALGLATPTSIMVGTGLAAKLGILIKDAEALEVTHSVTTVAFDKTGTLTEGKPSLVFTKSFDVSENEFLKISASIQATSDHPLAKAVIEKAKSMSINFNAIMDLKTRPGMGVEAIFENKTFALGNIKHMTHHKINLDKYSELLKTLQDEGKSVSLLAEVNSKKVWGVFGFFDQIKPEAKLAVKELQRMKIKTVMITGDNQGSAKAVGLELGIDEIRSEVLPQDKAREIEKLKSQGEIVAMVGDGINDAPALAMAHVGLAMSTGTDVAMHSAGITLMRGNPLLIPDAIEISKRTYSKIQQNLFWAFLYNIIGIPLAAFGLLNPMIAGAAMALSSFSVVTNALWLRKWKPVVRKIV